MDFVKYLLIFLHILGGAAIVGGWFANFKKPTILPIQLWGAIAQLVTGLALVCLAGATHAPLNYIKITVKLLIAIVVLVPAIIGFRKAQKNEPVSTGLAHAVGGMALINIAVATLWH
ncbi:conserved hypothetical protein [Renibacterium salmoninarum ATCC 33209]|uniref:Integral membrane protein n=1 Tax=Renibacterium salmoninarum (strain ATCC 33209 / DSM 20767 / JCM 11484 / NBRC 15589 / NCIMB 2235) TaxID=288705 RepID=A9WS33_RENSM|nr:hypothetical protein [Renibacterium salmoninarum]ABY24162.1 conserved hypothetical protein [Renibacterium salmoninarum ATCC 33209]